MGLGSKIIIALLVALAVPYYFLLVERDVGDVAPRTIDLAALRRAAQVLPGQKPTAIEYEVVARRDLPGTLLVAGGGFRSETLAVVAWRLRAPGGDIVIDTGMTASQARTAGYEGFDEAAEARVQAAMARASLVVLTHEQVDHVGGLLAAPDFGSIAPRLALNPEQHRVVAVRGAAGGNSRVPPPLSAAPLTPVAPGVVLLRTPGFTPGSQMVFVQTAMGREYLFTGDVASMHRNLAWVRPRSPLVAHWIQPEDRPAVVAWLKGLDELHKVAPALAMVHPHDFAWLARSAKSLNLHPRFGDEPMRLVRK